MTKFHEALAPLLVGFTVTKIEAGEGCEGDPAKITCRNGDVVRTFEVWAGIYGPCVSHIKEFRDGAPEVWTDVEDMFTDITNHVIYVAPDTVIEAEVDPDKCPRCWGTVQSTHLTPPDEEVAVGCSRCSWPEANPPTLCFGFRCRDTGKVWLTSSDTVKASRFASRFSTEETRAALAQCLTDGWFVLNC